MKLVALLIALVACGREPSRITIGAAASLRHAMPELVESYRKTSGTDVDVTYGASDVLADQVKRGVDHDALVLADPAVLDGLIADGVIAGDGRRAIAANRIALVGADASGVTLATLTSLPAGAKIAIGDPGTVPVGRYAKSYLQAIGSWAVLEPRLVYGGDVAAVLALAKEGKARVAIVYRTDAAPPLVVLDEPSDAPHVVIVGGPRAKSSRARAFIEFLASRDAQAILARHGFLPPH